MDSSLMSYARRAIEFEEHLFMAHEVRTESGALISTYVSPLVDKFDPLWYSIRKKLAGSCYTASEPRVIRDPLMMFGCAYETEFRVFDECPVDADHYCLKGRETTLSPTQPETRDPTPSIAQ